MNPGKKRRSLVEKGQVCLETAIALTLLLLFLSGAMAVFNGMNQ